jgi:hypothetical protein
LLLEKMQIVELNRKDVVDSIMLLREHQIGDSDADTINAQRIAYLFTRMGALEDSYPQPRKIGESTKSMEKLTQDDKTDIESKIEKLSTRINDEPKSRAWKMRARIGERKKGYKDVEELSRF